jgi:replication-associated recombination protein RarA
MSLNDFYSRNKPSSFDDLVFANEADANDLSAFASRKRFDHLLFYGPNGSAKSATATIIVTARQHAVSAPNMMVERFSARDLNGNIEPIMNSMGLLLCPVFGGDNEPYVIIEEVDQMNTNSQYDLRMLMDTMNCGKLIMTTNNLEGVDRGIRDRSEKYELLHPTPEQWLPRARTILANEGAGMTDRKLLSVLRSAGSTASAPTIRDMMRALAELTVALGGNTSARR